MNAFLRLLQKGDAVGIKIGETAGVAYWPLVAVELVGDAKILVDWSGNLLHFDRVTGARVDRPEHRLVAASEAAEHNRGIFT